MNPSPSSNWLTTLQGLGETPIDAIIRVRDDPTHYRATLEARGIQVRRILRLVNGLAVRAPAHLLLAIANEPWIISIEPDHPVHPMPTEKDG